MGIVLKVNMTTLLLLIGFAFGGQPLFSMIVLILTAIIFLAAPFLMKCFIKNESIINDGTVMLRWQVITMICVGIVLLMTIIFQSMGKVAGSFILSISRQGIIFLVILVITYNTIGYMGFIISQATADLLTVIIAVILFKNQLYKEFYFDK